MKPKLFILPRTLKDHKIWVNQYLLEQKISKDPEKDINLSWTNQDLQPLGIKQVRELISQLQFFAPSDKTRYVIILKIDEAGEEAQNALLKTLEEETKNTQFIITACDKLQVLPTVISRCVTHKIQFLDQENSSIPPQIKTDVKIVSYTQAINLSEKLAERPIAYDQLQTWLYSLAGENITKHLNQIKIIRQALIHLKQNANVRLVLENCFFQLKTATSK